jgi:PleD family two-component response regulator
MQKLLETVVRSSQAKLRNIRILTRDDFARQFIEGQKEYSDIEVVTNLQYALDGLLSEIARDDTGHQKAEIIGDKVLAADSAAREESMALKFHAEGRGTGLETIKEALQNLRIAAIDDDCIIQELIKNTFEASGAIVKTYSDGSEFLASLDTETFDLAFLDLMMPKVDGFAVLRTLQARDIRYPVIVLSAITQRETVIKAFQMGIKSYLVKPLKPADIFKKSLEILKVNF